MDGTRVNDLVQEVNPLASDNVVIDGATTRRTSIQHLVAAGLPAQIGTTAGTVAAGDDVRIVGALQPADIPGLPALFPRLYVPDAAMAAKSSLASDGHANWVRLQSGLNYNPIELVIYGSQGQGFGSCAIGGDTVTRISGTAFTSAWVGKEWFYFNGKRYRVASFIDVNNITVEEVGGGAVSFPATVSSATYHYLVTSGDGVCDVNGTAVTRISGQPFTINNSSARIIINGVSYTYTYVDPDHVTLGSSAGVQSGVGYRYEQNINDQISTIRVQKLLGGSEENLSLYASALGEYHIRALYAGSGSYYKIKIGSGDQGGKLRDQLVVQANGDLTLGGDYNNDALRIIGGNPATLYNRLEVVGSTVGFGPMLRVASGAGDANLPLRLEALGGGDILIQSGNGARTLFRVAGSQTATSYVGVYGSTTDAPAVEARGGAADIDLSLVTKGAGKVRFGTFTSGSDASITGYITIKDEGGNVRKLATIA